MRVFVTLALAMWFTAVGSPVLGRQDAVKAPDGKQVAVLLDCSSCRDAKAKGKECESGVDSGFHAGVGCGQCLLKANYGHGIATQYPLHFYGHLNGADGKPLEGKFVRLFMPNTWSIRTRTGKDGLFVMRMGATLPPEPSAAAPAKVKVKKEKKAKVPKLGGAKPRPRIVMDLGTRVMTEANESGSYSLFLMPSSYKPCASGKP